MKKPADTSLPFFAYGIFKPGQLGFLGLRDAVATVESPCTVLGVLRERDGLPILDAQGQECVGGCLLTFAPLRSDVAYESISGLEPDSQYRWAVVPVRCPNRTANGNILLGRNPAKGSMVLEDGEWDGRHDPLLTTALDVVRQTLAENEAFDWDLKPMFRLQMAYLLLWSAIERYASLRYGLGTDVNRKLKPIATDAPFREALRRHVVERDEVSRADKPQQRARLDRDDPSGALEYFYRVRSNIAHRGKAVTRDHERVRRALAVLLPIFEDTLRAAFAQADLATANPTPK